MKPTISNAFNNDPPPAGSAGASNTTPKPANPADSWELRKPQDSAANARKPKRNPRKSLASSLASMQADLRETDFGFSLELRPMQAADAVQAVMPLGGNLSAPATGLSFLVSMEQSSWRDGDVEASISDIVQRLAIPVIERIGPDQLVMEALSLCQLISLCQPSRLLVVAVDGTIEAGDAQAIDKAVASGLSPLLAELRAEWALEVIGDRSIVLHCRDRNNPLTLVAENFRHYLAALTSKPVTQFEGPELWQIERLLSLTGGLTIRPIETQLFSTSIDIGINTSKERFTHPADRSLIYDVHSNTWHDEP